jgi:hypothetical protein
VRTISIEPLVVWRSRERLPSAGRLRNGSPTGNDDLVRTALRICLQPQHLRRTLTIEESQQPTWPQLRQRRSEA